MRRWGAGLVAIWAGAACAPGERSTFREGAPPPAAEAPGAAPDGGGAAAAVAETDWLAHGSADERFRRVAAQLRGFDTAMVETGYRYAELYWAGRDANWDYAAYQLDKLEVALANAVVRQPRRAASSRLLETGLSVVRQAVAQKDASGFERAFGTLSGACNTCHIAERVAFIRVEPPPARTVITRAPGTAPP